MNVGMNKPFLTMVDLKPKWGTCPQLIIHENVAPFYQNCNMFGHFIVACKRNDKLKDKVSTSGVVVVEISNTTEISN